MKKTIITAFVALNSLAIAQPQPSFIISSWDLSLASGLNDGTGTNNGTWMGSSGPNYTMDRCGNATGAIQFNGTSEYIKMTNGAFGTSAHAANAARSISFWLKTTNTTYGGPSIVRAMFNDGQYSPSVVGTRWEINHNYTCLGIGADISMEYVTRRNTCFPDGNWHHMVVTQPGASSLSTMKVYLDGSLLTSANCSPTGNSGLLATVAQYITIGCVMNGSLPDRFFSGSLDDFYLYSTVLSSADVTALYNLKCTPPAPCVIVDPGCCLGNYCANSQVPLTGDYEIPFNGFNFNFTGDMDVTDKVNVGYACGASGIGKLNAVTNFLTNTNSTGPESISIYGRNIFSQPNGTGVGIMGDASHKSNGTSVGIWGEAKGQGDNIGGKFYAGSTRPVNGVYNVGVSAFALPSTGNPAPYTYQTAYPLGANIGVYAAGELSNSTDPSSPGQDWAAWFDGDVNIVGNCFSNLIYQFSDKRFKKDIKGLENMNEKIGKINAYTYSFRTDEFKLKGFDSKTHIGLIAQEIKEVFPELVTADNKGYYAVDYQGMIPVLLQASKEQQALFENQQTQIEELKALANTLLNNSNLKTGSINSIPVNLNDKNAIVLNQNVPNPFAESTVISYNIPTDFTKAQILFSTNDGQLVKVVDLTDKKGNLNIFANDLSHGVYSYKLVVDGKTIDTKKMVKQ